ncbi:MAG: Nucleoside 5-triphosphatase RdgB (dHAPTP, dITP, XTP-specific) [uncultured Thermomicrobiales bacterium]|uniref:Nucleoside 5-triphosphatase RdgB (DHAPTP, dITP, XTP-specific) n=1 Tax=uncultured Thermomicrobiales bacterium TaxID=1645740 RepID=A0A6J4TIE0_9BACT|nr:MAG: Nucleoside 5-triphosphatase RdgB (dHAPTP, dITP, XTP-specific) [uncultured Thermomicrobiales bacterium]
MPDRLLFVSGNAGKAREVEAMLGVPVERLDLDLPEIQALDVAEVARHKAREAFAHAGRPVIVEDTGLYLDALNGLPGALVKWFLAAVGPAGICALLPPGADRSARARTAVAICDGAGVEVFVGETPGEIATGPRGDGGFGWDPVFRPRGGSGTFAEMDAAEKAAHSMRRRALEGLRERLRETGE